MLKKNAILGLLAATALSASAAVPFEPTTIADGKFADGTKWYTMQIAGAGYYLYSGSGQTYLPLDRTTTTLDDTELWCFVGSEADGFAIYNKATGTAQQLGAPNDPANSKWGTTGANAYAILKDPGASGYSYLWDFSSSSDLSGKSGWYIAEHGQSSYALNNRGNKLAFWTGGKDGGSTFVLTCSEITPSVANNIVTLDTNPAITLSCEGGTATLNGKQVTLSAGKWVASTPAGYVVATLAWTTADGKTGSVANTTLMNNDEIFIEGPAVIADFKATLSKQLSGVTVFKYTGAAPYNVNYRIPAITTVEAGEHAGRLWAVNDYRVTNADIGAGRLDLHMSYSDDNGVTWTEPHWMLNAKGEPVSKGTGAATPSGTKACETNLDCGYGDPAVVSDRETGEMLVVSCCGRMPLFSGRRADPQPSARWWSKDGGETWTEPDYTHWEQIYALFDGTCPNGYIDSQFIGSGRIMQSRYIKVGDYYRIYAVMSGYHAASGNLSNWVLYSDDFGRNWHVLGDPMQPAQSSSADEPKAEELPDGSVLLAARRNGGNRNFNIFRYTDTAKGEGRWGTSVATNMGMGNINACNGEIMIVPVANVSTGEPAFLALQSFPYGGGRNNVSIAWKVLDKAEKFDEPSDFTTWDGRHQVSNMGSAYSTMCWTKENKLGFFFEEDIWGAYSETYVPLTIEQITDGAWKYQEDVDHKNAIRLTEEMMKLRLEQQGSGEGGKYVGMPNGANTAAEEAAKSFEANPNLAALEAFNAAMLNADNVIKPVHGGIYRFLSGQDGTYASIGDRYLAVSKTAKTINVNAKADYVGARFVIVEQAENPGHFYIYNPNAEAWFTATTATQNATMKASADWKEAKAWHFLSQTNGHTAIVSDEPGNATYPALHMDSTPKIVIWTTDAGASQWYMELLEMCPEDEMPKMTDEDSIVEIGADGTPVRYFDLQGRPVATPKNGLFITTNGKKILK